MPLSLSLSVGSRYTDFLHEESALTRLVQDALGGNAHALLVATVKADSPRDWQQNLATMRCVPLFPPLTPLSPLSGGKPGRARETRPNMITGEKFSKRVEG